ncbi:glycosyltransferase family 1 protein [Actinomadura vinacea]|uniref:Glycosyltransferase family 1 protein n=1 Tax=Actinomadura vinacea TaxID=115336 RepID=A0ABN3KK93_9ACTN
MNPMTIAMVSEHASPLATRAGLGGADGGGQNVCVADLATEMGRQGHHVTVYTRRDAPDLPRRVRLAQGVTVEHVPAGPPGPVPKDELLPLMPGFGRHLERRWAQAPPDVVHAHFWLSGLASLQAAERLRAEGGRGVPVVQTFHALGTVKRRHQGERDTSPAERPRLEAAIGRTADAVIASCTDETRELLRMGVPRERICVVPCGVDLDRFRPEGPAGPADAVDDSGPPGAARKDGAQGFGPPGFGAQGFAARLVVLSRLVERKGVDTAIEALAQIPGAGLVVAGGTPPAVLDADPEVRRLREVARAAGVHDRVAFLGRVRRDEVPVLLRSADLVVTLPWYEPFGMVPLEAMACGVPVVATGVGGHLDSIVDGVTGVQVPPRRPGETARRVRELLADPTRRAAMGFAGSDRARSRYSWARIAQETLAVYARAAAQRGDPMTTMEGSRS